MEKEEVIADDIPVVESLPNDCDEKNIKRKECKPTPEELASERAKLQAELVERYKTVEGRCLYVTTLVTFELTWCCNRAYFYIGLYDHKSLVENDDSALTMYFSAITMVNWDDKPVALETKENAAKLTSLAALCDDGDWTVYCVGQSDRGYKIMCVKGRR
jgi:hypothetical protein